MTENNHIEYSVPEESIDPGEPKKKMKKGKKIAIFLVVFFLVASVSFSNQVLMTDQSSTSWLDKIPIIRHIKNLVESADKELKGEDQDKINILLLGMGGKNHEGGYLTDTIILASLEPSTKKVALISIPRDLAVPVEDMGWRKINNINAYAEVANPGSGGLAISQAVSDMLDIPIDYYVRVDFDGFINIVDELDGVEVYVENILEDFRYPILGKEEAEDYESRFEHLYIAKGWQTMDGSLALKYARSRHAAGVEGSDFARARRQQKILEAAKEKILSLKILFKPTKISNILNELEEHVSTNLKIWEMVRLWDMFKDIEKESIVNKVLDNSPNSLLAETITDEGAYVLVPRGGDYTEVQYFINNIFSDAPMQLKTEVEEEKSTIEVRNGTWINGLASQVSLDLERYGFIVVRIGNSSRQNFEKSVIYDLSFGKKNKSLNILKEKTNANISLGLPEWLKEDIEKDITGEADPVQPDFILILGQDADITSSGLINPVE